MYINSIKIKNFRLLKEVEMSLERTATIIVGRNNSGKTSFTEIFRRLLSENVPRFNFEDFSLPVHDKFWNSFLLWRDDKDPHEIRESLPIIELTFSLIYDMDSEILGPASNFIIDLDPTSNKVLANIKYQLKDGNINSLFEDITFTGDPENIHNEKKNFFRAMKARIPQQYSTSIFAIDPKDYSNQKLLENINFRSLLQTGFITAQRGLDDITNKDKDVLGKVVERMLNIAKSDPNSPDDSHTISNLEGAVKDIQDKLDSDFNEHLNKLLPSLSLFGYPGLANTPLHTETILDVRRLLENHTKVRYPGVENGITLPETYNGLGSRNLIYILFQLYEFFKSYKAQETAPNVHLVFIEEPEAHLHPQMQEVFIRKITEIVNDFSERFNGNVKWPIQIVITTHSTHIANQAPFEAIRYFLSNKNGNTRIKDLRNGFTGANVENDKEFLHKYLTLTKCDLFFADKAILIEGTTERILMPKIIGKFDDKRLYENSLSSSYLTIIEVGGAYAHHFFSFLNFLELKTLIITDIDSVKPDVNGENSSRKKCLVAEGEYTSNTCIKKWFDNTDISPGTLLTKSNEEKIKGLLRIAYQIPDVEELPLTQDLEAALKETAAAFQVNEICENEEISSEYEERMGGFSDFESEHGPTGRSFEDAFMLANKSLFNLSGNSSLEIAKNAWDKAKKEDKTNFALNFAINNTDWNVPKYIIEGLTWLCNDSFAGELNNEHLNREER